MLLTPLLWASPIAAVPSLAEQIASISTTTKTTSALAKHPSFNAKPSKKWSEKSYRKNRLKQWTFIDTLSKTLGDENDLKIVEPVRSSVIKLQQLDYFEFDDLDQRKDRQLQTFNQIGKNNDSLLFNIVNNTNFSKLSNSVERTTESNHQDFTTNQHIHFSKSTSTQKIAVDLSSVSVNNSIDRSAEIINNNQSISNKSNKSVADHSQDKLFLQEYGYKFMVFAISLFGVCLFASFGIVRCLRATRRASRALALPKPLLSEDRTPLNAEPEHPVSMLSVQSPSYAGMERLGVPIRTSIGPSSEDRNHLSRRMCVDAHDLLVRDGPILSDRRVRNSTNSHHHYHHIHSDVIRCPHHVALPDNDRGPNKDIQTRTSYQQTEITRPYIKAPPNKTALDVPEQSYNLFPQASVCNLNQRVASTAKSKPNPITKFFLRISSPKSPESTSRGTSPTSITSITNQSHSSTTSIYKSGYSDVSTNHSISSSTLNLQTPTMLSSTTSLASTSTINSPNPENRSHV